MIRRFFNRIVPKKTVYIPVFVPTTSFDIDTVTASKAKGGWIWVSYYTRPLEEPPINQSQQT